MNERFGFCNDCKNKNCCNKCYRGSYYERNIEDDEHEV